MARSLAIPALLAATLLAGSLLAGSAWTDDDCAAPMTDWQPRRAVAEMAATRGWQVHRIRVDDGCYLILGQDADGRSLAATVDPATLEVVGIDFGEDEDDDEDDGGHDSEHGPEGRPPPGGRPAGGKAPD